MTELIECESVDPETLKKIKKLVTAFERSDCEAVESTLRELGSDGEMYRRVGQMTRCLHDSLKEFKQNLNRDNIDMNSTNLPDATDKLEKVLKVTYDAANETLNCCDQQDERLQAHIKELAALAEWAVSADDLPTAAKERIVSCCEKYTTDMHQAVQINQKIFITQEFQDVTGQALKKVIQLVSNLEKQLLGLVTVFGAHGEPASPSQPSAEKNFAAPESAGHAKQDDVDDLLKNLGF